MRAHLKEIESSTKENINRKKITNKRNEKYFFGFCIFNKLKWLSKDKRNKKEK